MDNMGQPDPTPMMPSQPSQPGPTPSTPTSPGTVVDPMEPVTDPGPVDLLQDAINKVRLFEAVAAASRAAIARLRIDDTHPFPAFQTDIADDLPASVTDVRGDSTVAEFWMNRVKSILDEVRHVRFAYTQAGLAIQRAEAAGLDARDVRAAFIAAEMSDDNDAITLAANEFQPLYEPDQVHAIAREITAALVAGSTTSSTTVGVVHQQDQNNLPTNAYILEDYDFGYFFYGYWLQELNTGGFQVGAVYDVESGAIQNSPLLYDPNGSVFDEIVTYDGSVFGLQTTQIPGTNNYRSSQFNAYVQLTADFSTQGAETLSGTIESFVNWDNVLQDYIYDGGVRSVRLSTTSISPNGFVSNGVAAGFSNGVRGDTPGTWNARSYGTEGARPDAFVGTFNAHFPDGGAAGGFYTLPY